MRVPPFRAVLQAVGVGVIAACLILASAPAYADDAATAGAIAEADNGGLSAAEESQSLATSSLDEVASENQQQTESIVHDTTGENQETNHDALTMYSIESQLEQSNQLAINIQQLQQQAQMQMQTAQLAAAAQHTQTQSGVGPDGCPTAAPDNTLREGADSVGVGDLCAQSVAQARTAAAAGAVKWALNHLGLPYSQPNRNQDAYADCSSFVTRAYQDSGTPISPGSNAPTTFTIKGAPWAVSESLSDAKPGDLIEPFADHVAMKLADSYMVHTNHTGDVSHVKKAYTSAYWVGYVDPSKA